MADMWRYVLMARPIKPRIKHQEDDYAHNPLNVFLDIPKEDIVAKPTRPRMQIIDRR